MNVVVIELLKPFEHSDADIVVNIQGDEPFLNQTSLKALLEVFESRFDQGN